MQIQKISGAMPIQTGQDICRTISATITNKLPRALTVTVGECTNPTPPPFTYNDLATFTLQPGQSITLSEIQLHVPNLKEITLSFHVQGGGMNGDNVQLPERGCDHLNISLYPCWNQPRWGDPTLFASTTYDASLAIDPND